jgi:CheY-like chemotaxis protein
MAHPQFAVPQQLETILLVEDEPLVRIGLAEFLRENGYRVLEANDAQEALAVLTSGPAIDLVISDVRLPGETDGFALGRRIQAEWPEIKFIATSGSIRAEEDEIGGPVLIKPYSRRDLLNRVDAALGGGRPGSSAKPAPR